MTTRPADKVSESDFNLESELAQLREGALLVSTLVGVIVDQAMSSLSTPTSERTRVMLLSIREKADALFERCDRILSLVETSRMREGKS